MKLLNNLILMNISHLCKTIYCSDLRELPPGKMLPNKWVSSSSGTDSLPKLCGCSCCVCRARLALQLLFWDHFQSSRPPAVQRAGQAEEGTMWWGDRDSQGLCMLLLCQLWGDRLRWPHSKECFWKPIVNSAKVRRIIQVTATSRNPGTLCLGREFLFLLCVAREILHCSSTDAARSSVMAQGKERTLRPSKLNKFTCCLVFIVIFLVQVLSAK